MIIDGVDVTGEELERILAKWREEEAAQLAEDIAYSKIRPLSAEEVLSEIIKSDQSVIENLDDASVARMAPYCSEWAVGTLYSPGAIVKYEEIVYRCLQAHTSTEQWTPVDAPSLWAKVLIPDPEVIPDWEQPDSTNPYMKGDKVRFENHIYESLIDNNVWSPSAYPAGWKQLD